MLEHSVDIVINWQMREFVTLATTTFSYRFQLICEVTVTQGSLSFQRWKKLLTTVLSFSR